MTAPANDGAMNGRLIERAEDEAAERIHALLLKHRHVFLVRPDGENVSVELHSKRGLLQSYTGITVEKALDIIDDAAGTGHFGVALHVHTPPLLVQKLALIDALASAIPEGGVQ